MSKKSDKWVTVARIVKPQGIKGGLKLKILSDNPERFKKGACLWLRGHEKKIENVINLSNGIALILDGITDRNQAEEYRNEVLSIPAEELKKTTEGTYYCHDLVGMKVNISTGKAIGEITDAYNAPSCDIIELQKTNGTKNLVPLKKEFVLNIDLDKKIVVLNEEMLED